MEVARKSPQICLALVGPTASGKTQLALEIALALDGEIICMDSTTVYRGFDVGTSKPTAEQRAQVPHHLLDVLDPTEPFSAFHFVQQAEEVIASLRTRDKLPIVVGGTYFYLRALQHGMYSLPVIPAEVIEGIEKEFFEDENLNTLRMHRELAEKDPPSATAIHPHDRYRLLRALAILRTTQLKPSELKPAPRSGEQESRRWMKYGIALSRQRLHRNIVERTDAMLRAGLVEETRQLSERYPQARALASIGYSEARQLLTRKLTLKQLPSEIIEKTRQLAKRQTTWLRSDPEIRYIDHRDTARVKQEVDNLGVALGATPLAKVIPCTP